MLARALSYPSEVDRGGSRWTERLWQRMGSHPAHAPSGASFMVQLQDAGKPLLLVLWVRQRCVVTKTSRQTGPRVSRPITPGDGRANRLGRALSPLSRGGTARRLAIPTGPRWRTQTRPDSAGSPGRPRSCSQPSGPIVLRRWSTSPRVGRARCSPRSGDLGHCSYAPPLGQSKVADCFGLWSSMGAFSRAGWVGSSFVFAGWAPALALQFIHPRADCCEIIGSAHGFTPRFWVVNALSIWLVREQVLCRCRPASPIATADQSPPLWAEDHGKTKGSTSRSSRTSPTHNGAASQQGRDATSPHRRAAGWGRRS